MKTMKAGLIVTLFMLGVPFIATAFADSEEETETLRMFYKEEDIAIVSATRFPKLKSQTAENITVITAKEIEEMNAHTLADVLLLVPGVQIENYTGLGGLPSINIQGSFMHHVPILIDGVRMNNLSNDTIDISAFPVQNIERIEIIKGPASSTWGSSIGGIINIITKDPSVRKLSGTLSASLGEKNTGDYRAEASGRINEFGYYLYGGYQNTNGTVPGFALNNENNFYTKLNFDLNSQLSAMFTFGYIHENKATGEFIQWDEKDFWKYEYLFSTLQLDYGINEDTDLKLLLRTSRQNGATSMTTLSTGESIGVYPEHDKDTGASLLFSTKQGIHSVVFGSDFDEATATTNYWNPEKQGVRKHSLFVNDTISFSKLTLTPGARYDYVDNTGSIFSPSLGVTYKLTDRTLLRFFAARGFSAPSLSWISYAGSIQTFHASPNLKYEKVLSLQAGIETTAIKYLHIKVNLFSHRVKDAIDSVSFDDGTWTMVNKNRQKREGFEAELKTLPVYNTSLTLGICYINARDLDTGEKIIGTAKYTYDIGFRYDDKKSMIALLKGHYIKWETRADNNPQASIIWDFNISKKVYTDDEQVVDIFASVHNVFNGAQYSTDIYQNPKRWLEAGVRYKF